MRCLTSAALTRSFSRAVEGSVVKDPRFTSVTTVKTTVLWCLKISFENFFDSDIENFGRIFTRKNSRGQNAHEIVAFQSFQRSLGVTFAKFANFGLVRKIDASYWWIRRNVNTNWLIIIQKKKL